MRILDEDHDQRLDRVTLYLTKSEAEELKSDLEDLIHKPEGNHTHVSAEDFQKEITVCIYDPLSLNKFSDRSKKLIMEDV